MPWHCIRSPIQLMHWLLPNRTHSTKHFQTQTDTPRQNLTQILAPCYGTIQPKATSGTMKPRQPFKFSQKGLQNQSNKEWFPCKLKTLFPEIGYIRVQFLHTQHSNTQPTRQPAKKQSKDNWESSSNTRRIVNHSSSTLVLLSQEQNIAIIQQQSTGAADLPQGPNSHHGCKDVDGFLRCIAVVAGTLVINNYNKTR